MDFSSIPVFFEGTWRGQGKVLPKGVPYKEEATFKVTKRDPAIVMLWDSRTKHAELDKPMHAENGFLKLLPNSAVAMDSPLRTHYPGDNKEESQSASIELLLSHPFGVNELYSVGVFDFANKALVVEATSPDCFQRGRTAKGKKVTGVRRVYRLEGETTMLYSLYLGVDGGDLVHHLEAKLQKA